MCCVFAAIFMAVLWAFTSFVTSVTRCRSNAKMALIPLNDADLRDVPFVEHFARGEWNEGGSGMTKVFFKND